jgi:glycosyltransferase involved in cell wall biosynthesis
MLLSIILPIYNVAKYLPYCLDSILRQQLSPDSYEVIMVNDGSTDSSLDVATAYAEKNVNFTVIDQENKGVGAARNVGLDVAKGAYIHFLDPDDYLTVDILNEILATAKKFNTDILAFNTKDTETYSQTDFHDVGNENEEPRMYSGLEYISEKKYGNEAWWYIINRDFLLKTGVRFMEGRWMEDAIFTINVLLKAKRIVHLNRIALMHVKLPSSAMNSKEESHYKKLVYDYLNAGVMYNDIINSMKHDDTTEGAIKRMRVRQDSFVFFGIARAMQSTLKFQHLWEQLKEMKAIGIYPLKHFNRHTYTSLKYKVLKTIFNSKTLLSVSFVFFRKLKLSI